MNGKVDLGTVATVLGAFGLTSTDPASVAGKPVDANTVRVVLAAFGLVPSVGKS